MGTLGLDDRKATPQDFTAAPVPPKWYLDLNSNQKALWTAMRQVESRGNRSPEMIAAREAFIKTVPGSTAYAAANFLGHKPEELSLDITDDPLDESGAPFADIAWYDRLTAGKEALDEADLEALRRKIHMAPSFFTPTLLDACERLASRGSPKVQKQVQGLRLYLNGRIAASEWMTALRQLPDIKTQDRIEPCVRWVAGTSGQAVALLYPIYSRELGVRFVPRPVAEAVFAHAVVENRALVPDFATAVVSVENKRLGVADGGGNPLLASTTGQLEVLETKGNFNVSFYLTHHEVILAAARKRALTFSGLILLAAASALIGFFAARRAFRQQVRLSEQKSNFVSSVSHELRAPIASVRLLAEGLERGRVQEPEKQKEYFQFITQECRRLSSLIENVLDFARIEQGRKEYEMEPGDLAALARETARLMQTYADERQVQIKLQCPDALVAVEMDGKAMQQALINLIDNAVKHSPKGSDVTVGLEIQSGAAQLWVEDHGGGIPAEEHERIFERFYRLGSELRRETQGVGIGLSIVKHIVEAHGGRVIVRSAPGQGSRFTIELSIKEK